MAAVGAGLRRGAISALAMVPAVIGSYVLVAWAADQRLAAIVAWAVLAVGTLIAVFVPASARLVAKVAAIAGQPVSGFFAAMYVLTVGLGYLIGGLVLDEVGAVFGGVLLCALGLLPFAVGRFMQLTAPGLWLVYALVLSVLAALLLPAFGSGLVLVAPAAAAWMAATDHRARLAGATTIDQPVP